MRISRWRPVAFGCLVGALWMAPECWSQGRSAPQPPGAVLTGVQGSVEVLRAGSGAWRGVSFTTLLGPGDAVRAGPGGEALLLTSEGKRAEVRPGIPLTVAAPPKAPAAWFQALRESLAQALDEGGGPLIERGFQLRGFQLRGPDTMMKVVALQPRSGSMGGCRFLVLDGRPLFRWRAGAGVTALRVSVMDTESRELWSQTAPVGGAELRYPADRPALAPGVYIWKIAGRMEASLEDDSQEFAVPDAQTAAEVRRELDAARPLAGKRGANLALAGVCLRHGLLDQAETALRAAWRQAPKDRTLPLLIADLYRRGDLSVPEELVPKS